MLRRLLARIRGPEPPQESHGGATHEPERLVAALLDVLGHDAMVGEHLKKAAILAIGPRAAQPGPGGELVDYCVVYPPDEAGKPVPD